MTATKERYGGQRGGIVGYHGIRASPRAYARRVSQDRCTDRQANVGETRLRSIVATHVKGSSALHNHFVINSVSVKDGKKYRWQKGSYRQLRKVSDELCRQHQLSIIENPMPKKVPRRQIWIAEKQGKVTIRIFCGTILTALYGAIISYKYFLCKPWNIPSYVVVRDSKYKHLSVITEGWSNPLN